jgi:hypothetical protein
MEYFLMAGFHGRGPVIASVICICAWRIVDLRSLVYKRIPESSGPVCHSAAGNFQPQIVSQEVSLIRSISCEILRPQ